MLISAKTTRRTSIFFHQKKRNYYLGNTKIISPKYCGIKMREPKNQMLGTMEPPAYAVKC